MQLTPSIIAKEAARLLRASKRSLHAVESDPIPRAVAREFTPDEMDIGDQGFGMWSMQHLIPKVDRLWNEQRRA